MANEPNYSSNPSKDEPKKEKVRVIPLEYIDEFPGHPFKVLDDESMQKLMNSMVNINGTLKAVGYALLVLFFLMGIMKHYNSMQEIKRPEQALKLFIRFVLAKAAVTWGLDLMMAMFTIVQGIISKIMASSGIGGRSGIYLPGEMIKTIEDCGFWESIADSYAGSGKGIWKGATEKTDCKNNYRADTTAAIHGMPVVWDGIKAKDMIGIPWMLAFALRADGWYLRSDIIWNKTNGLPENVKDRPTKSYEHIFLLTKSPRYYYDAEAIAEPIQPCSIARYERGRSDHTKYKGFNGNQSINEKRERGQECKKLTRNRRDVWNLSTNSYRMDGHFAMFPERLVEPCILAGCPVGGVVLDPFFGSGTTGAVAKRLGRQYIGIDLNPAYCRAAEDRIRGIPDSGERELTGEQRNDGN